MSFFNFLKRNTPAILTGIAMIGVPLSSYLTAKSAVKTAELLKDISDEDLKSPETRKELVQINALPVICILLTMGTIAGCHFFNKKLQAGYLAAYSLLSSTFEAWKLKLPLEQEMQIETDVDIDTINKYIDELLGDRPGEEYELWSDKFRKKPFWARKSDILLGKDEINKRINPDPNAPLLWPDWGNVSLEVFYSHTKGDTEPQDCLYGWNIDYLLEQWEWSTIDIDWASNYIYKDPETGMKIPCNRIYWSIDPQLNYWNYKSEYE